MEWTQADLAKRAGTNAETVSRHEGGASVTLPLAHAYAEALRVHPAWLLYGIRGAEESEPEAPPQVERVIAAMALSPSHAQIARDMNWNARELKDGVGVAEKIRKAIDDAEREPGGKPGPRRPGRRDLPRKPGKR